MRIHTPAATNGQMFEGALITTNPADFQRRFDGLIVGVRVGHVAIVGKPVVIGTGKLALQGTDDFFQIQLFLRQFGLTVGAKDIQITVFAAEINFAIAHRHGSRNGLAESGGKRPSGLAIQRRDIQLAIQTAVHTGVFQQHSRGDGGEAVEHIGFRLGE